uniref:Fe2OG dioxygenase domain-containing protein n=1 Tax=Leersia perrieri TaxID=77586 RepID=A0A0D9VXN2_9ORYZ
MVDSASAMSSDGYDRLRELKAFDETKAGVKGFVDAGVTTIPRIFHHPPDPTPVASPSKSAAIPVIDLAFPDRDSIVSQVSSAAESVGFFQVVNHGVPAQLMESTLAAVRSFNEQPTAAKREIYTRDTSRRVRFNSNFDLYESPAANWRDTLFCQAAPDPPRPEEFGLPFAASAAAAVLLEYAEHARRLALAVLELISSALGLDRDRLGKTMGCAEGVSLVSNYYPPCPEPDLTVGTGRHSDPAFLTVLLQDGMGGLQALLDGQWVDVPPVNGALVVNVGDLLELVSNGRLRSVEHRVVANRSRETARVSVAAFCNVDLGSENSWSRLYGPIAELISGEDGGERPQYRSITVAEFLAHYDGKGLDGCPALHHFRLPDAAGTTPLH